MKILWLPQPVCCPPGEGSDKHLLDFSNVPTNGLHRKLSISYSSILLWLVFSFNFVIWKIYTGADLQLLFHSSAAPGREKITQLQKWKIGNINTSLIAASFGCGWVNWAQICSMQCLPDYHIYLSLVRLFSIILIQDLKIYLTCQNQFEILENSRHRVMRRTVCINIHWSLESLSISFLDQGSISKHSF